MKNLSAKQIYKTYICFHCKILAKLNAATAQKLLHNYTWHMPYSEIVAEYKGY